MKFKILKKPSKMKLKINVPVGRTKYMMPYQSTINTSKMTLGGVGANCVSEDFGSAMGLNIMDIFSGKTSVLDVVSDLAYTEAMKQVSKYGNIVTSFANKAKSAANGAISTFNTAQASIDPTEIQSLADQAQKFASTAAAEYNNAVKNYSLTSGALNALKKIPGLPSTVKTASDNILAAAKKSLDSAKASVDIAANASEQVQTINAQRGGGDSSFLPSFSFESPFMQQYGTYLMVGGGILAASLLGFFIYKRIK